jgi:hypothetical protein
MIKLIVEDKNILSSYLDSILSFEKGLITVYVGWDLAKKNGASILNKKINEETYWTFLPTEKRNIFESDITDFKDIVFEKVKKEIKYNNINPLEFENKEKLVEFLTNNFTNFKVYLYKGKIYFYNDKKIYHLDLNFLDFMSCDINDYLNHNLNILKIKEKEIKYLEVKYIPYLIDAKENNIISDFC